MTPARLARERVIAWTLLGLVLIVTADAVWSQWGRIGRVTPGFAVMARLLVAVGGLGRGGLQPFDLVRAVDGQLVPSARDIHAAVAAAPPGTVFRYLVNRRGQLVEVEIASRVVTRTDFINYVSEGLLPSLLFLALAAVVLWLKPGAPDTRLFLAFGVTWWAISGLYADAHTTYRWEWLFLTAWVFSPAVFVHLALTFPERRTVFGCRPRLVWLPYLLSGGLALALQVQPGPVAWSYGVPAVAAAYWGLSLLLLIVALARASVAGTTPLARQRARVLLVGFAVGQLVPVLGTVAEAVFRVEVPYLHRIWRLNLLFPLAFAYAMVRYNLFDLRAVLRTGTIYAAITGLVVLAYAGAITLVNLASTQLGFGESSLLPAATVALAVVLFLNPVYLRTQGIVDRLFFPQRLGVQASLERLADEMTTALDLDRIGRTIGKTVEDLFAPTRCGVLVLDESRGTYEPLSPRTNGPRPIPEDSPLLRRLAEGRMPLTREQVREDPTLTTVRDVGLAQMDAFEIALVVPVYFRGRMTAVVGLGAKRSGAAFSTEDLRLLRLLCNQSAVALENAKAYSALEASKAQLETALRRVEILESIRANLSKFVPKTVQALIEQAPAAPELHKREVDVSVLFVDIAGYTRLSERLDLDTVNNLVERYFGSFLDEILRNGGDVNETAGDGLMVIFQDLESDRHAEAAVRTAVAILRRTAEINAERGREVEAIRLHVGVNSGVAALGATKIEGKAGTRWVYTASGPVTNQAARLAALGDGDAVVIGHETRRRLSGGWEIEDAGEQRLRNVEQPVRVFRVALATPTQSRV